MAFALRIRRRLWIALAAIAALLATAGASTGPRCEAMPAGCTTFACCEDTSTASPQAATAPALSAASTTRGKVVGCPTSSAPCVCRCEAPIPPAQKPGDRVEEHRVEHSRDVAANPPSYPGPRVLVAIAFMPDVGPPRSPLYLRTSRLLI